MAATLLELLPPCDAWEMLAACVAAAWAGTPLEVSEVVTRLRISVTRIVPRMASPRLAGRVVPYRLGDAGGLAVGEFGGAVHRVGAGRPEHEPDPGAGEDDVPLLGAEAERRHLRSPQAEAHGADNTAQYDGQLGPAGIEQPATD